MSLDKAEVRRWIDGMREADRVNRDLTLERLRHLTVAESVQEYRSLKQFVDAQDAKSDDPELWHRRAAEEYRSMLDVFRKVGVTSAHR